jgi:hypothetical protein
MRNKERETRLTLQEHDDDDDDEKFYRLIQIRHQTPKVKGSSAR